MTYSSRTSYASSAASKRTWTNAVLIKLNQIGTLSETNAAVRLAYQANWGAMVSHRSGETVDSFIADLTVALATGHLKTGAPCRGERVEKYNQLMRIAESLGGSAVYACGPTRLRNAAGRLVARGPDNTVTAAIVTATPRSARGKFTADIARRAARGEHITLFGPRGSGKTALLHDVQLLLGAGHCAYSRTTQCLDDITCALERAYGDVATRGLTRQRPVGAYGVPPTSSEAYCCSIT